MTKLTTDKLRIADSAPHLLTCTIDQLVVSPLNVRLNQEDATSVDALAASIAARGLLFPLIVHDMAVLRGTEHDAFAKASEGKRGILAGGRRFRAITQLIERGALPADWPIDVVLRDCDPATITELSLAENLLRRELRPYEIHAAVARAHAQGASVEEIAANCGQRKRWVEQHLRLGELAPEIFAAYVAGQLSFDQASAFAATADQQLQVQAWAHFAKLHAHDRSARAIRAFLKVGDRELARNLQFVGETIYRGAGGRFELDLFADGPDAMRGRVVDEELLAQLTAEKMEVARSMVRSAWGFASSSSEAVGQNTLRFAAEPPKLPGSHSYGCDPQLEVRPKGSDWEKLRLPRKAAPADFVATIEIEPNGDWTPRLWWVSRKAKAAFEKRGAAAPAPGSGSGENYAGAALREGKAEGAAFDGQYTGYEVEARRIVRDAHGLTADGIDVVRAVRRDLLRALLLTADEALAGDVPRDYLTWSALRIELADARPSRTGARGIERESFNVGEREPTALMIDQREGQEAAALWGDAVELLSALPAFTCLDEADGLRDYLAAAPAVKRLAEAVLAGLALVRSASTPGWRVPAHDVLAEAIGGAPEHVRRFWRPTASFTGLFGKLARQEMVQPFVDEATRRQLAKAKDRDLSARTAEILAAQLDWLHPLLAFAAPSIEETAAVQDVELAPEPV